jgi:mevalonate kinase
LNDAVSACGKVILVGEHAVVYGAAAIALALTDCRLELAFTKPAGNWQRLDVSPLLEGFAMDLPQCVYVRSQIPIGAGLGSSAALCTALVRAVNHRLGIALEPYSLALKAQELERHFHGNPSGLDTTVVSFERHVSYRLGSQPYMLPLSPRTWHMALIDSATSAATKEMVERARPFFCRGGDKLVESFDSLAKRASEALRADHGELAQVMMEAQALLSGLGIMTDALQRVIAIAKELGASAAKVTGAGGGGFVLALLPDVGREDVVKKLQDTFKGKLRLFSFT